MTPAPGERDALAPREPAGRRWLADLADLSPAYFGMVMATGIVSLAAHLLEMPAHRASAVPSQYRRLRACCGC